MSVVARFEILKSGFIDADGSVISPLPPCAEDPETIKAMYRGKETTRNVVYTAEALE